MAIEALRKEGAGLTERGAWDLSGVRELRDVLREAREKNITVHHGRDKFYKE